MYFSIEGTDYWYEVTGEGTPIVLLHGFTGTSATWNSLIETEAQDVQFITIDMPGHGKTKGNHLVTMDDFSHDLESLLDHLNLEKIYLVGYSMGGRAALSFAAHYPERLIGLALESASPGLATEEERRARIAADEKLIQRIETEGIPSFVDFWQSIALFDTQKHLSEEVQVTIREERLSQRVSGLVESLRGMGTGAQHSNWEKLFDLSFPVLLIVGHLDEKFVAINEQMSEWLPNATMEIFIEAGHAVHVEKPALFNECILGFANYHTS